MRNHFTNPWPALVIIALSVAVFYLNIFRAPFVFDDEFRIVNEIKIRALNNFLPSKELLKPRAIVDFTFALNYKLNGLNVFGYHLTNVLIHILNGFLVCVLGTIVFRQLPEVPQFTNASTKRMSLFAALIFVVHPIQTQAVTYTVQRYASMAAMFYLASVLFYLKARMIQHGAERIGQSGKGKAQSAERRANKTEVGSQRSEERGKRLEVGGQRTEVIGQRIEGRGQMSDVRGQSSEGERLSAMSFEISAWYFFSILCGMLAFLSKQNTASLPGAILLGEYILIDRSWQGWKKKIPWYALSFTLWILFVSYIVGLFGEVSIDKGLLEDVSEHTMETEMIGRWHYFCTQFNVLIIYIRLLFLPYGQNLDWLYPFKSGFFDDYTSLVFLFLSLLVLFGLKCIKRRPVISLGIFWFVITLSVESSIIPIRDALLEHRLYLPLMGFSICWVYMQFEMFMKKELWFIFIAITILLFLGTGTYLRNWVWQDEMRLWADVISKNPQNHRGYNNLGVFLKKQGRLEEAIDQYLKALRIESDYADAHSNLGAALSDQGKLKEAIAHYYEALRIKPDLAEAHNNLGYAIKRQGKLEEAIGHYLEALRIKPEFAAAHNNLGNALKTSGNIQGAIKHYAEALRINPDFAEAHNNLGAALFDQGKLMEAIVHYQKALRLKPGLAKVHNNLGNALIGKGKHLEAVKHYSEAIRIKPDYSEAYSNLGAALVAQGKLNEALEHYSKALRIKPDNAEAHNNLGAILLTEGKLDEAIKHYGKALRIKPDYAEAHNNLGNALKRKGSFKEAIKHYHEALKTKPNFAEAHYNLGVALMDLRKFKEAIHHFTEALRIKPDFIQAQKRLERCLRQMDQAVRSAA